MAAPLAKCCFHCKVQTETVRLVRHIHVATTSRLPEKKSHLHINSAPPEEIVRDWIGPPDKISNIRSVKCYQPKDESLTERQYREQREAVQQWHHEFWTSHNKEFFMLKDKFVQERLAEKQKAGLENETISAEEMSEFYKKFLDDNYREHLSYNKQWYKYNMKMLMPSFKVNMIRLWKRLKPSN